jgi:3,4-dihydroxy 2-butanone 4-phosphate synthase/GTP cyclohydrolase II
MEKSVQEGLHTIAEAIEDMRHGKVLIVVDDEDRENEGDFIAAAHHVTPEVINFMSKFGRGLICCALTESRCEELQLDMMVTRNTDPKGTAFTVSVDLLGHGCTTGISAQDRAKTVQALIDPTMSPEDFGRPGHIFPLKARNGGVLKRTGHTEATVDLARLAGYQPAGVLVEIMNDDGTMARLPQLLEIAKQHNLKIISIKDLISYRLEKEQLVEKISSLPVQTKYGEFSLVAFRDLTENKEHFALVKGEWKTDEAIPVRVHSSNLVADLFNIRCGNEAAGLDRSMEIIQQEGRGAIVYINHLQHGRTLLEEMEDLKVKELRSDEGNKPVMDSRNFGIGAQILRQLGIMNMKLITNHPVKRSGLTGYGLEVSEIIGYR